MTWFRDAVDVPLGFASDLWFHERNGEVFLRDNYIVVRHPQNPVYLWGNLIYFFDRPNAGAAPRWATLFAKEFSDLPGIDHRSFGWSHYAAPDDALAPFIADGYYCEPSHTLVCKTPRMPARYNPDVVVREVRSDAEWQFVLENQIATRARHFDEASYRLFFTSKWRKYRELISQGFGTWFAAYVEGEQVADLGMFCIGRHARVQRVATSVEHRGRGVCATLLFEATKHQLRTKAVESVIISADPEYHAIRIYKDVGYEYDSTEYMLYNPKISI